MMNRETHKELCEKYESVKADAKYWETQAKTLRVRNEQLLDDVNILSAQLKLWKGTAP
jgi:hypothetical protein